jgi:hypothetical protein
MNRFFAIKQTNFLKFIPFISLVILCLIKVSPINLLRDNYLKVAIFLLFTSAFSFFLLKPQKSNHKKIVFSISILGAGVILISQLLFF